MDPINDLIAALLLVAVLVMLLLRYVVCWYFRINERTELLRDIRNHLLGIEVKKPKSTLERLGLKTKSDSET